MDRSILAQLDPVCSLSAQRLTELAGLCFVEKVSQGLDPFRMNVTRNSQALYLLKGELALSVADGGRKLLRGGTTEARQPMPTPSDGMQNAQALTDLEIIRIDTDLLDIMMTWDQLAGYEKSAPEEALRGQPDEPGRGMSGWMCETGAFGVDQLHSGLFSQLPPANVEQMFRRMSRLPVKSGQTIIVQGADGDYYYLIESGVAEVTRQVEAGQPPRLLAELQEGEAFGEEALVSDSKRNATVIMKTDGMLLRLGKADFAELLQAPLVAMVSPGEAGAWEASGTAGPQWLDVRYASEYNFDHRPHAINVPLHEIRDRMRTLDPSREYITCCQTGRRSSAAAFIMAQHGFKVFVLEGGLNAAR